MISETVLHRARHGTGGAFLVAGLLTGVWNTRLPALQARFDLSTRQVGLVIAIWGVAALLSMGSLRRIMARHDSRALLRLTLPLSAAGLGLCGLAPSFPWLVAAVVLFGAAFGAAEVTVNAQGSAVERALGRPVMNGMHACWSIGTLAGGLAGAAAVFGGLGLQPTFLAAAAVTVPAALLFGLTYIRDSAPPAGGGSAKPAARGLPGTVLVIGGLAFCALLVEGAVADWSAIYLSGSRGAAEWVAALGHVMFGLGMLAGRVFGDRLRAVVGAPAMLGISGIATGGAVLVTVMAEAPAVALAGFALTGLAVCTVGPLSFSMAGTAAPRQESAAIARTGTLGYTGLMLGPVLISLVADATSLRVGLAVLMVPALFIAVAGPVVARRTPGPRTPTTPPVWTTPGGGLNVPSAIHRTTGNQPHPVASPPRRRMGALMLVKLAGIPIQAVVWFVLAGLPLSPANLLGFGLLAAVLLQSALFSLAVRRGRGKPLLVVARWGNLGLLAAGMGAIGFAMAAGPASDCWPGLGLALVAAVEYVTHFHVLDHGVAPPRPAPEVPVSASAAPAAR